MMISPLAVAIPLFKAAGIVNRGLSINRTAKPEHFRMNSFTFSLVPSVDNPSATMTSTNSNGYVCRVRVSRTSLIVACSFRQGMITETLGLFSGDSFTIFKIRKGPGARAYFEPHPQACSSFNAINSISTIAPFGNPPTCTVERAGGFSSKYSA